MGVPILYAGSQYYPGIPPSKQYPAFSAAEVGNVAADTVAVTFSVDVSASNYATGVTIKVNGSAATISSATRQSNHAIVYYVLSAAVVNGDTVTWEYSGGSIVNEATGAALQTTSAQSVTNNVVVSGPQFSAAEIGTVNASTVAVTFDSNVSASNYATGVTIKVNGTATSITSATRQANHAIVYYVIPVLWHGSGDTVTWEYASGSGNIVSESDSTPLGDVSAQSVTNNCEYAALLDLQADTLALSDGDPVATWPDQSGNGNDFTQTGSARPAFVLDDTRGYSAVYFDAIDDVMIGPNFADNLASFTIVSVCNADIAGGFNGLSVTLCKLDSYSTGQGWIAESDSLLIQESGGSVYYGVGGSTPQGLHVFSVVKNSNNNMEIWRDQVDFLNPSNTFDAGPVTTFTNNEPVRLGADGALDSLFHGYMYAIWLYTSAPSSTNRAALEARVAARYGITL